MHTREMASRTRDRLLAEETARVLKFSETIEKINLAKIILNK